MIQWAQHVHTIYLTFDSCYMIILRLFVLFALFLCFLPLTSYFRMKTTFCSRIFAFFWLFSINFNPLVRPIFTRYMCLSTFFHFIYTLPRNIQGDREWLWAFFTFLTLNWVTERNDDVHNCFCFTLCTQPIRFDSIRSDSIGYCTAQKTHIRKMDSGWW